MSTPLSRSPTGPLPEVISARQREKDRKHITARSRFVEERGTFSSGGVWGNAGGDLLMDVAVWQLVGLGIILKQ